MARGSFSLTQGDRRDRRAAGALGTGAWAVAASATAAFAHLAIERLDDAAGTASGFASHAHPLFAPTVLLSVALSGIGLWSAIARRMDARRRGRGAPAFFGSSIRRISFRTLAALVFAGALAILLSIESIEQIVATGHASLALAFGAHWPLGIALVALIALVLTSFGASVARTAVTLLVAGARALEVLARLERIRTDAHVGHTQTRSPLSDSAPLARCRALRAPPLPA